MHLVKVVNDPRFYFACHSSATGRAASVTKEDGRYVVTGTWEEGRHTMELAELSIGAMGTQAEAASSACKFAVRWARGVSR